MITKAIEVGEKAPTFTANDHLGNTIVLEELLKKGSVILVFYRGQWCPICNKHLKDFQSQLSELQRHGASVLAVTPEKPEYIDKTIEKTNIDLPVIHDDRYAIMKAYGVAFKEAKAKTFLYNVMLKADFKKAHGDSEVVLPVPATYIIGRDGLIKYVHFDPDYKKRSNPTELIKYL
jgi:peroxiredoxin